MDRWGRRVAVVGNRDFRDYELLDKTLKKYVNVGDLLVSGGAIGADSMAQRWARENGFTILIVYPNWRDGSGAGFKRNEEIASISDLVLAFYARGKFQQGGTRNTVEWALKMGVAYMEFEEIQMFKKEGPALEPILQGLGTKNWARAYAQGYRVGFSNLALYHRSKRYRHPKMAAIPWDTGYAHGTADRIRKETGIREEESFIGQSLLRNLTASVSVKEEE